jgi:hypothetical protein
VAFLLLFLGMKSNKKEPSQMDKLTQGYEKFIKGKELNTDGKDQFEKAIKKAATPPKKQRGSK